MPSDKKAQQNKFNSTVVRNFLDDHENEYDYFSGGCIAIITQFLIEACEKMAIKGKKNTTITKLEVINLYMKALEECLKDLKEVQLSLQFNPQLNLQLNINKD